MSVIKRLEEIFRIELLGVEASLAGETDPIRRSDIAWYCIQRCLGASQLAMVCGGDHATIEAMFEGLKEKINHLQFPA